MRRCAGCSARTRPSRGGRSTRWRPAVTPRSSGVLRSWRSDRVRALYLLVMAGCVLVTLPLELLLGVRVYRRPRRLLLTLAPVLAVFLTWDALAVHARQWAYHHMAGAWIGNLPIEELVFFLVV